MRIKASEHYRVRLKERAEVHGRTLYPGRVYLLRGDALKTIRDKVADAEPVR